MNQLQPMPMVGLLAALRDIVLPALPTLIQWDGVHPAQNMQPTGVALQSLESHGLVVLRM